MSDPHIYLSSEEAKQKGCICEYGCRICGMHESQMGNCPSWSSCPIGRMENKECPLLKLKVKS